MESSPRNVIGAQGARSEASLSAVSGNSLDGSTYRLKLEVEALLAEKAPVEVKASKLEEALNALQSQKVRCKWLSLCKWKTVPAFVYVLLVYV